MMLCPCHRELGSSGIESLLAVPISFVSEHIETLEEIDMEYRELAHESGIKHVRRTGGEGILVQMGDLFYQSHCVGNQSSLGRNSSEAIS